MAASILVLKPEKGLQSQVIFLELMKFIQQIIFLFFNIVLQISFDDRANICSW